MKRLSFIAMVIAVLVLGTTGYVFAFGTIVVINEVFYDPSGTDTGKEWIELYNSAPMAFPLNGYCLYASGEHYVFGTFSLSAGSYVVVHWNAEGTDSPTDLYTGTTDWSNMGNTSGSVALFNTHDSHTQDTIVDFMEYGDSDNPYDGEGEDAGIWTADDYASDVDEGHSLEYDGSGDAGSDWFDQSTPTSGSENSLPVGLSSFTAIRTDSGVVLRWTTETEVDHVGWNIYRSEKEDGEFVKINDELIEGAGYSAMPLDYQYVDKTAKAGKRYYYYLEDLDLFGKTGKSDVIISTKSSPEKQLATTWASLKKRR